MPGGTVHAAWKAMSKHEMRWASAGLSGWRLQRHSASWKMMTVEQPVAMQIYPDVGCKSNQQG